VYFLEENPGINRTVDPYKIIICANPTAASKTLRYGAFKGRVASLQDHGDTTPSPYVTVKRMSPGEKVTDPQDAKVSQQSSVALELWDFSRRE
jgi:hypothetical protein